MVFKPAKPFHDVAHGCHQQLFLAVYQCGISRSRSKAGETIISLSEDAAAIKHYKTLGAGNIQRNGWRLFSRQGSKVIGDQYPAMVEASQRFAQLVADSQASRTLGPLQRGPDTAQVFRNLEANNVSWSSAISERAAL